MRKHFFSVPLHKRKHFSVQCMCFLVHHMETKHYYACMDIFFMSNATTTCAVIFAVDYMHLSFVECIVSWSIENQSQRLYSLVS